MTFYFKTTHKIENLHCNISNIFVCILFIHIQKILKYCYQKNLTLKELQKCFINAILHFYETKHLPENNLLHLKKRFMMT